MKIRKREMFRHFNLFNNGRYEVVVAQLVEQLLRNPEFCGLNPIISKNLQSTFTVNCIEKTKINKKRLGMAHFFKKTTNV